MTRHHASTRRDSDFVPLLDRQIGIDLQMHINEDHVPHLARAQIMYAEYARRRAQRFSYGLHLSIVGRPVHQVVQCIPTERPAHFHHHAADDQRGDRIQQRIAGKVADNAQCNNERNAASERACHALATNMLDFTRVAAASM